MMIRRALQLLLLLALPALAGCGPGVEGKLEPGDCSFEKLAEMPVRLVRNEPRVAVSINDWELDLVLDTGAQNTVITEQSAQRLKLRRTGANTMIHGIGGTQASWVGVARVFDFGGVRLRDFPVRVAPIQLQRPQGEPPEGLLGADVLTGFDIDLDLPNNRMTLYRPRRCPDGGPNWEAPHTGVPMQSVAQGRILLQMEVDGVQAATVLDTGAEMTTISRVTALRAGRGAEQLAAGRGVTITGATDKKIQAHQHRFNTVRIGRMVARDALLVVAELPPAARDGILGVDFMRGRRMWISYASERVYFTVPRPALAAQTTAPVPAPSPR